MPSRSLIHCEIVCADRTTTAALAAIVRLCARDVGLPLRVRPSSARASATTVTLHLPAALAANQHPVWCLACRLACFCPAARVSVLVHGETAFTSPRRRHAA